MAPSLSAPHSPIRSPAKCLLGEFSFARIPEYRVAARYDVRVTPHSDAGAGKVPLEGIFLCAYSWIPRRSAV